MYNYDFSTYNHASFSFISKVFLFGFSSSANSKIVFLEKQIQIQKMFLSLTPYKT